MDKNIPEPKSEWDEEANRKTTMQHEKNKKPMPDDLKEVYPAIVRRVYELNDNLNLYSHLFLENKERQADFKEHLGYLYDWLEILIPSKVLLGVAQLTDEPKDKKGNENLSILRLRVLSNDCCFDRKTSMLCDDISDKTKGIRLIRNKQIAHLDLPIALDPDRIKKLLEDEKKELPSFALMKEIVDKMIELIQLIEAKYNDAEWGFPDDSGLIAGAFVYTMEQAKKYERLRDAGIIPYA
jgi:hypothetical protein